MKRSSCCMGWAGWLRDAAGVGSGDAGDFERWDLFPAIPRLGIPDLQMSDCVVGVSGSGREGPLCDGAAFAEAMAAAWDPSCRMRWNDDRE